MKEANVMKALALALSCSLLSASPEPAPRSDAQRANEAVVAYLSAWNERQPRLRHDAVARAWAVNGTYLDAHRTAAGLEELDAMIATAQARFPGYALHLVTSVEAHHGQVRFGWAAGGTPESPLFLAGTDILTLTPEGRIAAVIGFVDAAPAH